MAKIDTEVQSAGVRRVLWITLALNLAVSAGKVIVGHLSGSLAMVADGYHSLVDGSNNVIGLIVAAFAFRPPTPATRTATGSSRPRRPASSGSRSSRSRGRCSRARCPAPRGRPCPRSGR